MFGRPPKLIVRLLKTLPFASKVTFRNVSASDESVGNFSSSIGFERGAAVVRVEAIVVEEPVAFALDSQSRTAAVALQSLLFGFT